MKKVFRVLKYIVVLLVIFGVAWGIWYAYVIGISGFTSKTLWDWMELLIIPAVLAVGVWWLNKNEKQTEREIATKREENERKIALDRQRQNALESYFDRMTDLLLEKGLRNSKEGEEVQIIARTLTLTVLRQLDANRCGQLLRFLYEADLISSDRKIDLSTADFSSVELSWVDLSRVDLSGVKMTGANLRHSDLSNANLSEADLSKAILTDATLTDTLLTGTVLEEADLTFADLDGAFSTVYPFILTKVKKVI
ncbi:MAG: pentapeptide repeat-containing protein [Chloroflexi bacterium]|nr:MAG: pentapeptide repeat-containing protein [Chloroflexota bacterium]